MLNFSNTSMMQIITTLQKIIQNLDTKEIISFEAVNPDICSCKYSGTIIKKENHQYICRGYKAWVDLAQNLHCRMLTPIIISSQTVRISYEKLDTEDSFHTLTIDKEKKYGQESIFNKIHKNEEPSFLIPFLKALKNIDLTKRIRILNLGVNSGDEFEAIKNFANNFKNLELIGIDYCSSAIDTARKKFKKDKNVSFYIHDINNISSLNLEKFDLILSIGTLQSSNLEFNPLFMSIVQNYLKRDGAMILGFPNCRWIDGEMIYGARVKNYPFSEMGLLYKDVIFCKKYLQKKKFRVTVTGKDYIFLTATSIIKV